MARAVRPPPAPRPAESTGPSAAERVRPRWPAWAALFAVAFAVHVASPNSVVSDSVRVVPVAESILHRRTISLDFYRGRLPVPHYGVDLVDGHVYPTFPWTVSLFVLPVVAAYDGAHALGLGPGVDARTAALGTDWEFQVVAMSSVVALATVVMYQVALHQLALSGGDARRRRRLALVAALVFSLGTAVWSVASRSAWQHGPSILLLAVATLLAVRSRSDPRAVRWLGLPLAAAYAVRPTNLVPLALFSAWVVARHRRHLPAFLGGVAAVLVPFVAVNLSAWGTVVPPYYRPGRLGGNEAFVEALAGNLVSPARGLFVFSPVLLLSVAGVALRLRARRFDVVDAVLVASVVTHWVAISTFPHWWGGDSYGPRLFSDMIPFLVVLSLPVLAWMGQAWGRGDRRRLAPVAATCAVLAAWSVFVNFQGAWLRSSWCWNNEPTEVDADPSRLWDWRDPQFLRGARRFASGPDRRAETIRGGVATFGCPGAARARGA